MIMLKFSLVLYFFFFKKKIKFFIDFVTRSELVKFNRFFFFFLGIKNYFMV